MAGKDGQRRSLCFGKRNAVTKSRKARDSIRNRTLKEERRLRMSAATTAIEHSSFPSVSAVEAKEFAKAASLERRQEFENILSHWLTRFRIIAERQLGNREDAEDAVQDAMLSAFTHIARFDGRAKMSTWLTAIVLNAVRMNLRRRPRGRMLSLDWSPVEGQSTISELLVDLRPTPERTAEISELYKFVVKATRKLPPSQKAALRLRQEGEPIRKAAARLGIPEGTLKAQLARGRAKITEQFRHVIGMSKTASRP